jgi:excisionase family DNA binding protein
MEQGQADEVMDPKQVGIMLGLHEKTVRNMLIRGEIPGHRFGKSWRCRRSAIYKMIPTEVTSAHAQTHS